MSLFSRSLAQLIASLQKARARQIEAPHLARTLAAAVLAAVWVLRLFWKRRSKVALTNSSSSLLRRHRSDEGAISCAVCSKNLNTPSKNGRRWASIHAVFADGKTRPTYLHCARDLLKSNSDSACKYGKLDSRFAEELTRLLEDCKDLLKPNACLRMCHEDWHLQIAARQPELVWPPVPPKLPPVQAIFALENVGELRISSCPLFKEVPIGLSRCRGLQTLVFISTGISSLPPEIGLLHELEILYLNGNFLRKFPKPICDLPNLTELCLDANQLKELSPITSSKLKLFTAPANQLTSVHLVASTVDRIELHGNALKSLTIGCPSRMGSSKSLAYQPWAKVFKLKLMGNKLRQLPEEIGLMVALQTLFVADNDLQSLPDSVATLQKLTGIYAYNNAIVDLPEGILLGSNWLDTLLLEGNPLSPISVASLIEDLPRCNKMKLLGLDVNQVGDAVKVFHKWQPLYTSVSVGEMLRINGNSQYYAKLMRASHIKRRYGRSAIGEPKAIPAPTKRPARILVVAFSASQGEPEWLGLLSSLSAFSHVSFQAPVAGPLEEFLGSGKGSDNMTSRDLWSGCRQTAEDSEDRAMNCSEADLIEFEDFDVLCLVDHRMRWYTGDEDALSSMLAQLSTRYEHKLFLGASMGGFGALNHAGHLASKGLFGSKDAVLTFGPQAVLNLATLRPPGEDVAALEALAKRMKHNAYTAAEKGAIVEVHCASDEHLGHALAIPLRDMALHIHPIVPRKPFAKLLHRTNLLLPVIGDALARLLSPDRAPPVLDLPSEENLHEARVVIARWTQPGGRLLRTWTTRFAYLQRFFGAVSSPMPRPGDWFCEKCEVRNTSNNYWCYSCFRDGGNSVNINATTMLDIGVVRVPSGNTWPRNGDWACGKCGAACSYYEKTCNRCSCGREAHEQNIIF